MVKPTFEQAVSFLKAKYSSHNKAAVAIGMSKSGYKYLVRDGAQRPHSGRTKEWLIAQAIEHGWGWGA